MQTAGRGRLGRTWDGPPPGLGHNLLCSVLLPFSGVPFCAVARVALAGRFAAEVVAGVEAGLKWPNDLVVDERKLAGVLAEIDGASGAVVVGIGMNVSWAPPGAAVLGGGRGGDGVSRDDVLDALLSSLGEWLQQDDRAVLRAYREACVTLGRQVRVELLGDEPFTGVAADVTEDGHLLVETDVCLKTVAAADIVHLR